MEGHIPVMLPEVLGALQPADGEIYIDGTYGGGGYARAILAAADCRLIGIDRDETAVARARHEADANPNLMPIAGRFGELDALARELGAEGVDGVVLDLGVSSFQLDEAERGFSFMRDGPLDMRMGQHGPNAADIVNRADEQDLADIIFRLGEERRSRRVARAIGQRRKERAFETTLDLAGVVEDALGGRRGAKAHPATKTFQAIRMFVNDELGELARALVAAERVLKVGGRLVIVTFHSLEDRMVKTFLRARSGLVSGGSRHIPHAASEQPDPSFKLLSRKAVSVSGAEASTNRRARSSRLRAASRTSAPAWAEMIASEYELPSLDKLGARA